MVLESHLERAGRALAYVLNCLLYVLGGVC
jgi:hypothetical protein